jgi:hypothetical protein
MQGKSQYKSRPSRGRPKSSTLTPREQARLRKERQRAKLAKKAMTKVEVLLPKTLKEAIRAVAAGKTLSEVGAESFQLWLDSQTKTKS